MDEIESKKLSELACQISGMAIVLKGYCENFEEDISEIANLIEFTKILSGITNKLFNLL